MFPNYRTTILDMGHKAVMPTRADCYSGLQEIQCQTDDPETIFYNKSCISASHVCRSFDFDDGNVTHCFKADKVELLRNLYTRILSSEEYFKYVVETIYNRNEFSTKFQFQTILSFLRVSCIKLNQIGFSFGLITDNY